MKRKITTKMINTFMEHLVIVEKSKNTILKYVRDVKIFASFVDGKCIDKTITLKYKEMLEEKYAATSANSMIASLNAFLRFVGWTECCVKQLKVQRMVYCPEEKEITREEYIRLVKTARSEGEEQLSLIMQTICSLGIRISELEYITVEAIQKGEAKVNCKGKIRKVFVVKDLQRLLIKYIKQENIVNGAVFVTKTGKPVNRSNVWRKMKELCQKAQVNPQKVFPHNLRHLFARTFYEIEKDIAKLADILGHSNINTTRIYIITTCCEHRKRMERMKLVI